MKRKDYKQNGLKNRNRAGNFLIMSSSLPYFQRSVSRSMCFSVPVVSWRLLMPLTLININSNNLTNYERWQKNLK